MREPLLLVAVFLVGFAIIIAYNRCNFAITPNESEASQRAERAAALLQQISDVIAGELPCNTLVALKYALCMLSNFGSRSGGWLAEREKQAGAVGSTKDTAGLLERLKQSDEKVTHLTRSNRLRVCVCYQCSCCLNVDCALQLKAKCNELEQLGAAGHGAKLKQLLEKERGVQAKISQLGVYK